MKFLVQNCQVILSVGQDNYDEIEGYRIKTKSAAIHKLYLPYCPPELLTVSRIKPEANQMKPNQNILTFVAGQNSDEARGIDYNLTVTSSASAADQLLCDKKCRGSTKFWLVTLGTTIYDEQCWNKAFQESLGRHVTSLKYKRLAFQYYELGGIVSLKERLQQSTLCVLKVHDQYQTFCMEGLWALHAGIPLLVSQSAGISPFLEQLGETDPIVDSYGDFESDLQEWCDRIKEKLCNPKCAEETAEKIQRRCLLDTSIVESHIEFLTVIAGNTI